jgi:hypothetical protein
VGDFLEWEEPIPPPDKNSAWDAHLVLANSIEENLFVRRSVFGNEVFGIGGDAHTEAAWTEMNDPAHPDKGTVNGLVKRLCLSNEELGCKIIVNKQFLEYCHSVELNLVGNNHWVLTQPFECKLDYISHFSTLFKNVYWADVFLYLPPEIGDALIVVSLLEREQCFLIKPETRTTVADSGIRWQQKYVGSARD